MKITLLALFLVALTACERRRAAERCEFPSDFRGWAVVAWGEHGFPALPTDGAKLVLRFPANGIIITSTEQQFGWASDEFYFLDASGHRSGRAPIAFATTGSTQRRGHTMRFSKYFVGTDAELKSASQGDAKVHAAFVRIHPNASQITD